MSVDVTKLRPDPTNLKKGKTDVTLSYFGFVEGAADNPVQLTLNIDPNAPAFFVKDNNQTKTLKTSKKLSFDTFRKETWDVTIEVTMNVDIPTACSLRLNAKDASGGLSSTNSFVIIQ